MKLCGRETPRIYKLAQGRRIREEPPPVFQWDGFGKKGDREGISMPYDEKKTDMDTSGDYDYSLESILAEYKGSAFIRGQSRMAKDELEREAARIIEEYTGIKQAAPESSSAAEKKSDGLSEAEKQAEQNAADSAKGAKAEKQQIKDEKKPHRGDVVKKSRPSAESAESGERAAKRGIGRGLREVEEKLQRVSEVEERQAKRFSYRELSDDEQEFFGVGKYSRTEPEKRDGEVERAIARAAQARAQKTFKTGSEG